VGVSCLDVHRLVKCSPKLVWYSDGDNKNFPFFGIHDVTSENNNYYTDALRGNRPYMDLHAGSNDSESVRALFDTGAVTSVLSTNAFKWLQARGAVKATVPTQGLVLQTADGSALKMTGAHLMKFRFRKQQLEGVS